MPTRQLKRQAAPATSYIEHAGAGLQTQLRGDVTLLLGLGQFKTFVAILEIGAGVLQVGVEEEAIEFLGEVIVVGEITGDGSPHHQEVAQRTLFQDKRAVHVGFTHAQHGVGQYAPWNSGIREPDARRWRVVRAEDMPLSPGIDNHERAMLYGTPERRGEKVECGAVGQN